MALRLGPKMAQLLKNRDFTNYSRLYGTDDSALQVFSLDGSESKVAGGVFGALA